MYTKVDNWDKSNLSHEFLNDQKSVDGKYTFSNLKVFYNEEDIKLKPPKNMRVHSTGLITFKNEKKNTYTQGMKLVNDNLKITKDIDLFIKVICDIYDYAVNVLKTHKFYKLKDEDGIKSIFNHPISGKGTDKQIMFIKFITGITKESKKEFCGTKVFQYNPKTKKCDEKIKNPIITLNKYKNEGIQYDIKPILLFPPIYMVKSKICFQTQVQEETLYITGVQQSEQSDDDDDDDLDRYMPSNLTKKDNEDDNTNINDNDNDNGSDKSTDDDL